MATAGGDAAFAGMEHLQAQHEEEAMTPYSTRDLDGDREFKIVRSITGQFRKPEAFRRLIEEEKRGGWTFVEKFDDIRVRFKRPAHAKLPAADFEDGYEPYRTTYPDRELRQRLKVLGLVFAGVILTPFALMLLLVLARAL